MLLTQSRGSKALPVLYWLPKMLLLRSSLTVRKRYAIDNHKKMQTILLKYQISVLRPDNNITTSIYKRRNVLLLQTVE